MARLSEVGVRIREARKAAGLSRDGLATLSGVSRARIEALENGRAREVGYTAVRNLLRSVGLDLAITTYNRGRPTLEDLQRENEACEREGQVTAVLTAGGARCPPLRPDQ